MESETIKAGGDMVPGSVFYIRQPIRKATATFWLDMFFGFLGVHRFYLGHIGMGLVYLFTGGLFAVGAIVDLFIAWKITRKENERRGYGFVSG